MAEELQLAQSRHEDADNYGDEQQPSPPQSPTESIDPAVTQKAADILDSCKCKDASQLRTLAESKGGLVSDELRQQAWPILLGVPTPDILDGEDAEKSCASAAGEASLSRDWRELPPHEDEAQVKLDVDRAFIYYPSNPSDAELNRHKQELSDLITEVLRRYPFLCYFQGYHDICQVFVLVLQKTWRAPAVARLSALRIRDFMLPSLAPTTAQLRLLPDILHRADPKLRRHISGVEPYYALSGTLTMYAHNIEAYHDIARLFDVFLAREPVFSIYVFAQIIISRRDEIFEIDEPDVLHVVLGKVPARMNLDALIEESIALFDRHPPETLPSWRSISSFSALKTMRNMDAGIKQTITEGREYFDQQAKEVKWAEFQEMAKGVLWAYRRPATTFGTALAVGALAFYLRRNPATANHIMSFFTR